MGGVLILVTSAPFAVLNVVSCVVYSLATPLVALTSAYPYFDLRTSPELDEHAGHDALPAEIALGTDGSA